MKKLILFLLTCYLLPLPISAQTPHSPTTTSSLSFVDLTGRGRPGNRNGQGAASRGLSCNKDIPASQLVALIPQSNLGLTVDDYPTFWFYNPYTANKFHSLVFQLYPLQGDSPVYQKQVLASQTSPGIIRLTLPKTASSLVVDHDYQWTLRVYCENPAEEQATQVYVQGMIRRIPVNPELEEALKAAKNPQEQAAIYAKQGIWYNALTILGNLRLTASEVSEDWITLLEDVDLKAIASKPMVDCCRLEE